jgi:hypothetical protein
MLDLFAEHTFDELTARELLREVLDAVQRHELRGFLEGRLLDRETGAQLSGLLLLHTQQRPTYLKLHLLS